jgi:hypothetical protein
LGAFGEAFAVPAGGAVGELSVDNRCSERAFGGVVGRLDALDGGERSERGPHLEQVAR